MVPAMSRDEDTTETGFYRRELRACQEQTAAACHSLGALEWLLKNPEAPGWHNHFAETVRQLRTSLTGTPAELAELAEQRDAASAALLARAAALLADQDA